MYKYQYDAGIYTPLIDKFGFFFFSEIEKMKCIDPRKQTNIELVRMYPED